MTRIGELCDHVSSHVQPSDRPNDICLSLAHVSPRRLTAQPGGRAADSRSAKYSFQSGDILYGKLRPNLDKAVFATNDGLCTTELLVLRPRQGISGRYLVCVLHTPSFLQYAVSGTTGAQHPRTSWNHIKRYRVPIFSYEEQEQIASYVWKTESVITTNRCLVDQGRRLAASAIDALLGDGSHDIIDSGSVPLTWSTASLGDLCVEPDLLSIIRESDRTIEYVDVSSICRELLRVSSTSRYLLREAPSRARKRIRTNDVIFATVRPKLMRVAIVPSTLDNQVCSTAFCVLRPNTALVDPRFIYYAVQRTRFVQAVGLQETGASYPAVTDRVILEQVVPVPPLRTQRKIVGTLDAIWRTIYQATRKICILEELRNRILLDTVERRNAGIKMTSRRST